MLPSLFGGGAVVKKLLVLSLMTFLVYGIFLHPVPYHLSHKNSFAAAPIVVGAVGMQALRYGAHTIIGDLAARTPAVLGSRTITPAVRGADGVYRTGAARWGGKVSAGLTAVTGIALHVLSSEYGMPGTL